MCGCASCWRCRSPEPAPAAEPITCFSISCGKATRDEETLGLLARHAQRSLRPARPIRPMRREHLQHGVRALSRRRTRSSGGYWSGINAATMAAAARRSRSAETARLAASVNSAWPDLESRAASGDDRYWVAVHTWGSRADPRAVRRGGGLTYAQASVAGRRPLTAIWPPPGGTLA